MSHFSLVLKFTERCNLNCSYCYYFNGLDSTFKSRPKSLSKEVAHKVLSFLEQGITELGITNLDISIHGGEPLLMPKGDFVYICQIFQDSLSRKLLNLTFSMQTNGTLIDEEWIKIFSKFQIKVGISIDGPKEYHDKYRVYHNGRGSYDKISKAIELLQKENYNFGVLAVIDPQNDPGILYDHFIKTLKIKGLDFLWPDFTYNRPPPYPATKYGEFVTNVFRIWTEHDDPSIQIRFLSSYLNIFLGGTSFIYEIGSDKEEGDLHLITIRSDGEISPTDELMSTDPSTVTLTGKKVDEITMKEFLQVPIFKELTEAFSKTPDTCKNCCWENVCRGGGITNRFSSLSRFNNSSIYCEGLKIFFSEVFQYLVKSGVSVADIQKRLLN